MIAFAKQNFSKKNILYKNYIISKSISTGLSHVFENFLHSHSKFFPKCLDDVSKEAKWETIYVAWFMKRYPWHSGPGVSKTLQYQLLY